MLLSLISSELSLVRNVVFPCDSDASLSSSKMKLELNSCFDVVDLDFGDTNEVLGDVIVEDVWECLPSIKSFYVVVM